MLRIVLPFLLVSAVCATYGGGGHYSSYKEYDCGGSCGGGCSESYTSGGCGQQPVVAPVVQYESSGCGGDDCGGGGGGHSSRYSSGRASSSGYHKSVTTVTKETRNDHLKIIVGAPKVVRTTYVQPAPAPVIYKKQSRYVDQGDDYSGGYADSGCAGPCGGGSKIVKYIKKTSYGGDVCTTCDVGGGESYSHQSSNIEYSQPIVRKVTRIITQPVVTRVIKTRVVQPVETSGEYYEDSGSSCGGGGCGGGGGYHKQQRYTSGGGGGGGHGGGRAKAFAFASASASAGAGTSGGGGTSGDYVGGGGGGCKSGCDEWKK